MDNYGFESKYSSSQIENMLDHMALMPEYGMMILPSTYMCPVNLDTVYEDYDIDSGTYQVKFIDRTCLPLDLQARTIDMSIVMLFRMDSVKYQQLFIAGTMYVRHYIDGGNGTGMWSEWENLIVGVLTDDAVKAALGYKPADNDDLIALQNVISDILEDIEKLQAKSDNNFNAIKIPLQNKFSIEDWFEDKVTIMRLHLVTYGTVALNTTITIRNIATDEIMRIENIVPHASYIYDLNEVASNLMVTVENASKTRADFIIEYLGPQDGKYGGLKKDPNKPGPDCCDGCDGSGNCPGGQHGVCPGGPPVLLFQRGDNDIRVAGAITSPVGLETKGFRW